MSRPLRIVLVYCAVASTWILFSDALMTALWPDVNAIRQISVWKGLAFVLATSGVLMLTLRDIGRREEDRYKRMFDGHPAAMLIIDPDSGAIVDANPAACAFYRYPRDTLQHMHIADINVLGEASTAQAMARVSPGTESTFHFRHRLSDGELRDVEVHSGRVMVDGRALLYSIIHDETERAMARQKLQRQENLYAAISEISEELVRLPDPAHIYEAVCRIAVMRCQLRFAWIGEVDSGGDAITPVAVFGGDAGYLSSVRLTTNAASPLGRGPSGMAVREGRSQINNDFMANPATGPWREAASRAGIGASAAFPIRRGGKVVATFNAYAPAPNYFDTEAVQLLERLVMDVSFALDNHDRREKEARASEALERAEARWRFALAGGGHAVWEWNPATGKVFYSPEWKSMLGYSEDEISDSIDEWRNRVHSDDQASVDAEIARHVAGESPHYLSEHRLRCKDGSYKWIADRGRIMSRDASGKPLGLIGTHTDVTERKLAEQLAQSLAEQMQLYLSVSPIVSYALSFSGERPAPIWVSENVSRLFGYPVEEALDPGWWTSHLHPEDRERALGGVEQLLAQGELSHEYRFLRRDGTEVWILDHLRLVRDEKGRPLRAVGAWSDIGARREAEATIHEYAERLENTLTATVDAMSTMVEMRDPYTAGHERRVALLAADIAGEMGLPEFVKRGLRVAGAVHDIGKIGVPGDILTKPGRLSDTERMLVQTHATLGYDILKVIHFPWPVAEIAYQHHERMDGSGYPQGLKGDDILPEARILAVADVVESMMSHRPYRAALGQAPALEEIERNSGRLYDPQAVAACLRLFRERGYVLPG